MTVSPHIDRLRLALTWAPDRPGPGGKQDGTAALDALAADLNAAQRQIAGIREANDAIMAERDAAIRERDRMRDRAYAMTEKRDAQMIRAESAEARVAELEAALRYVVEYEGREVWAAHPHILELIPAVSDEGAA